MELRDTFDTVAELYAAARPGYPDEIVASPQRTHHVFPARKHLLVQLHVARRLG